MVGFLASLDIPTKTKRGGRQFAQFSYWIDQKSAEDCCRLLQTLGCHTTWFFSTPMPAMADSVHAVGEVAEARGPVAAVAPLQRRGGDVDGAGGKMECRCGCDCDFKVLDPQPTRKKWWPNSYGNYMTLESENTDKVRNPGK